MSENSCELRVGRLLEIRLVKGYETVEDVEHMISMIRANVGKLPEDVRHVTIADWRRVQSHGRRGRSTRRRHDARVEPTHRALGDVARRIFTDCRDAVRAPRARVRKPAPAPVQRSRGVVELGRRGALTGRAAPRASSSANQRRLSAYRGDAPAPRTNSDRRESTRSPRRGSARPGPHELTRASPLCSSVSNKRCWIRRSWSGSGRCERIRLAARRGHDTTPRRGGSRAGAGRGCRRASPRRGSRRRSRNPWLAG